MCTVRLLHEKRILTLKKKWRRRLGKRSRSADIQFCKWLVSISLHSISRANISGTNTGSRVILPRALPTDSVYTPKHQKNRMAFISKKVRKRILEASSGAIRDATFWEVFFCLSKVTFLCRALSCTSKARWCLTIHGIFFTPPLVVNYLFPHLGLFLMQFLSILFSGNRRMKTAKSGKHGEIKGFKLQGLRQSWEWHLKI